MVGTKCGLSTGRRPSAAAEVPPSMAACGGRPGAVASAAAESSGCSCVVTCCSYSSHPQQVRCDPMAAGFVGRSRLGCVGARASRRAHNNCCAVDSAVVGGCRRQQLRQHLRQQPSSSSLHGWQNQLRRCIRCPKHQIVGACQPPAAAALQERWRACSRMEGWLPRSWQAKSGLVRTCGAGCWRVASGSGAGAACMNAGRTSGAACPTSTAGPAQMTAALSPAAASAV